MKRPARPDKASRWRRRRARLAVVILWLASTQAFIAGAASAAEPPLRYGGMPLSPYQAAADEGLLDHLIAALFGRIGRPVEKVEMPAGRDIDLASRGLVDFRWGTRASEPFMHNTLIVPEALFQVDLVALSRRVTALPRGWESLAEYSVAFPRGWKVVETRVRPRGEVYPVSQQRQLFEMLASDRADIVVTEHRMAGLQLRARPIAGAAVIEPPLLRVAVYLYLHDRHAGLVPELDAALKAMKADGSYQRIWDEALRDFGIE